MLVAALRALADKAKLLSFSFVKELLERDKSLTEILITNEAQDDWIQTEIMPTHEFEENGTHVIHAVAHVRDGINDLCCEIFFLENSTPIVERDIYNCRVSGLPEKTGDYI